MITGGGRARGRIENSDTNLGTAALDSLLS